MDGPSLPRSIRWRLQLGVWKLPDSSRVVPQTADYYPDTDTPPPTPSPLYVLEEIVESNHDLIEAQRRSYDVLVQELQQLVQEHAAHQEAILATAEETSSIETLEVAFPTTQSDDDDEETDDMVMVDPLTAMALERDANEQRLQHLDLKYRKERARRKRGMQTEDGVMNSFAVRDNCLCK